jgi:hypothetical protein
MDEDRLFEPPLIPPPSPVFVPTDPIVARLAELPTRKEIWRVALLATLTGAGLVQCRNTLSS